MSHHQQIINVTTNTGQICFTTLDGMQKVVTFDLVAMNDPMRAQIIEKDLNKLYSNVEILFRNMQRLHRNQYFYYERNREHKRMLN